MGEAGYFMIKADTVYMLIVMWGAFGMGLVWGLTIGESRTLKRLKEQHPSEMEKLIKEMRQGK